MNLYCKEGSIVKRKQYLVILISFLFIFIFSGCKKNSSNKSSSNKKLNIYVDIKDEKTKEVFKIIIDEFEKENKNVELNIMNSMSKSKIDEDMAKSDNIDMVVINRNVMLELKEKGIISDVSSIYEKVNLNQKFYSAVCAYGKIGDKYFGIPVIPYSLEIIYNKESIKQFGINKLDNLNDTEMLFKRMKEKNLKIPVILNEELTPSLAVAGFVSNNTINVGELEKYYDVGKEKYNNITYMQNFFSELNNLVKASGIDDKFFEKKDTSAIKDVEKGSVPAAIAMSYVSKDLRDLPLNILSSYSLSSVKVNPPIIVNAIICASANSKNQEDINKFLEFITEDSVQKKIADEGYITGNREANKNFQGYLQNIISHFENANENNVLFFYNLPEKMILPLNNEVEKVLGGSYSNDQWRKVIENTYK